MIKLQKSWENLTKTFCYLCMIIGKKLHMPVENLLRFEEQQFGIIFFKNTNFSPNSTRYLQVAQIISIMGLASKNMSHLNKRGSIFYFLSYEDLLESVSCSMKHTRTTDCGVCIWKGGGGGGALLEQWYIRNETLFLRDK